MKGWQWHQSRQPNTHGPHVNHVVARGHAGRHHWRKTTEDQVGGGSNKKSKHGAHARELRGRLCRPAPPQRRTRGLSCAATTHTSLLWPFGGEPWWLATRCQHCRRTDRKNLLAVMSDLRMFRLTGGMHETSDKVSLEIHSLRPFCCSRPKHSTAMCLIDWFHSAKVESISLGTVSGDAERRAASSLTLHWNVQRLVNYSRNHLKYRKNNTSFEYNQQF